MGNRYGALPFFKADSNSACYNNKVLGPLRYYSIIIENLNDTT